MPQGAPQPARPRYAGFGIRLGARAIDTVVITILAFAFFFGVLVFLLLTVPGASEDDHDFSDQFYDAWAYLFLFGWGGLIFLYDWLCHAGWGRTIGKVIVGIRVVKVDGSTRLSQGTALVRAALFGLPQSLLCVGTVFTVIDCAWPLSDARQQSLHDKAAKTVVVHTR
ncbi:putative RDD family membrane protein YckC [Murinocardiopsis flavida]|uniref:Putative RDD family membrane protein YckC n=1 Tax=Murinocardiopsis flavida TaxID=645275 RepID=A0A2P8CQY1_9ACTN|nr:putative RDD family membrane protein YckC [Murinocardiopsis flavida]